MLDKLKAKADIGAPARSISRTSWRHKLALVAVTASLAQVGYSDLNCGNYIWQGGGVGLCVGIAFRDYNGALVNGGIQNVYPSYNQCGDRYSFTHTACVNTTILLNGATYKYASAYCDMYLRTVTPLSRYPTDAAVTYTCGGTVPTPPTAPYHTTTYLPHA